MPSTILPQMRIHSLYTYPIKSIRGCSTLKVTTTPLGFKYDRRFLLFRVKENEIMYVSHQTEMCLFTTEISESRLFVRYTKDHTFDRPEDKVDDEVLEINPEPDYEALRLKAVELNMHSSPTTGYDMGSKYNEWFSKRFGYDVKLIYLGANRRKVMGNISPNVENHTFINGKHIEVNTAKVNNSWFGGIKAVAGGILNYATTATTTTINTNEYRGIDEGIGFSDHAPFLIVNTRSWENASRRLPAGEQLDVTKFRPNIIIEGAETDFEEDYWAELHITNHQEEDEDEVEDDVEDDGEDDGSMIREGTRIILTSNCNRCNSLNVDYETGKIGKGASGKILKILQSDRRVDKGAKYNPIFGRYGFLGERVGSGKGSGGGGAEIKVGDWVEVVKRNEERTHYAWPGLDTN